MRKLSKKKFNVFKEPVVIRPFSFVCVRFLLSSKKFSNIKKYSVFSKLSCCCLQRQVRPRPERESWGYMGGSERELSQDDICQS